MSAEMLRGWITMWNMESMVLLAGVALLLGIIAVVEVVASILVLANRRLGATISILRAQRGLSRGSLRMQLRPTAFPMRLEPINDRGSGFGADRLWRKVIINRLLSFPPIFFSCALITIIITAPVVAHAVQFEGVQIPDTLEVDGKTLHLNGYGLRKYSILGIHIYIASLYLEHLSTNPEKIIQSSETKLLSVRFEHNVNANAARKAWRIGLANNCKAPCHLDPKDVERFLADVPAMHNGDNYSLLFTQDGANVTVSGRQIGTISQPQFAEAMLGIFLGPKPASASLKQELLRGHG